MESIGQILKAARERRQISIADVVVATKMTSTFVKAIEADDFKVLVAPVYARGFIKLYAACVGLDPLPLLQKFDVSSRAAPESSLPSSKTPPRKASSACAGKLKPKPEPEKVGGRLKAVKLMTTLPSWLGAHMPIPHWPPSWLATLLAGRLSTLNRLFSVRVPWLRFKLLGKTVCNAVRLPTPARNAVPSVVGGWEGGPAGRVLPFFPLPAIVWRRIFIVAFVVLLIIAANMAWEWSQRGRLSTSDACRWLVEPPAPYLVMEEHPASPGR